jgi:hypothetical protein
MEVELVEVELVEVGRKEMKAMSTAGRRRVASRRHRMDARLVVAARQRVVEVEMEG